jgi:NitT/TauT family transport system ATP-binding protein
VSVGLATVEPAVRPVVLGVRSVCRRFDTPSGKMSALEDVRFDVHHRELISVIGPSGCGKSTLIRIIAGLDQPCAGSVCLDGVPVRGPGADRGMVFQQYTLFPWMTVLDNVTFGLRMKGTRRAAARREARDWLELVGLTRFAGHYPGQLSGGMKQRVAIARALANSPRILLMDEPFGALDAQTRASMQRHLLRIRQQVDVTTLFITHDLDEAILLSDRIVVLAAHPGRVREVVEVPDAPARRIETRRRIDALIHEDQEVDAE